MKLLRETIRRLIAEASEHICDDFIVELEKRFEKKLYKDTQYYDLVNVYPDGCEVIIAMEALEYENVWMNGIETVGDDCVRKGYARDTLQSIFDLADEMGIYILGTADPFESKDGSSGDRADKQELINFYKSMGIKVVNGEELVRAPQER